MEIPQVIVVKLQLLGLLFVNGRFDIDGVNLCCRCLYIIQHNLLYVLPLPQVVVCFLCYRLSTYCQYPRLVEMLRCHTILHLAYY